MSKYFFFGTLFLLVILYTIIPESRPTQDTTNANAFISTSTGQAFVALLRDTTGSRGNKNRYYLDNDWMQAFHEIIREYAQGMTLDVYSLSDKNQVANRLELEPVPKGVSRLNPRWLEVKKQQEQIADNNHKTATTFFDGIRSYSGKNNKDDTYLYPTLDNVAVNLSDSQYFDGPRVLVINSDLIHDEYKKAPEFINADYVQLLNDLAGRGVQIFMLSDNDQPELLDAMNDDIVWLSQPDDLLRYLKKILPPPK